MTVEATAVCCYHSYIAELRLVEKRTNSSEVGSCVLSQLLMQDLHPAGLLSTTCNTGSEQHGTRSLCRTIFDVSGQGN